MPLEGSVAHSFIQGLSSLLPFEGSIFKIKGVRMIRGYNVRVAEL